MACSSSSPARIAPPSAEAIRRNDRERLLAALLQPVETDEEDRALASELLAQRTNMPSFDRLAVEIRGMEEEVSTAAAAWYARARSI